MSVTNTAKCVFLILPSEWLRMKFNPDMNTNSRIQKSLDLVICRKFAVFLSRLRLRIRSFYSKITIHQKKACSHEQKWSIIILFSIIIFSSKSQHISKKLHFSEVKFYLKAYLTDVFSKIVKGSFFEIFFPAKFLRNDVNLWFPCLCTTLFQPIWGPEIEKWKHKSM